MAKKVEGYIKLQIPAGKATPAPPIVKIEWGDSGIFDNHNYILTSATYTLKNFQNGYRIRVPESRLLLEMVDYYLQQQPKN